MNLLIVSSAPIIYKKEQSYAYAPYVNELALLNKLAGNISFCCPEWEKDNGLLISSIPFKFERHYKLIDFNLGSIKNIFFTFLYFPFNLIMIFKAMKNADHIHLRCPGNMGLLGSLVQILFPNKTKTAKYAGNWDPKSKQPWSYKFQKWILNNTFLTKKMQVLVYGEWENQSKNIKSFFTATYSDLEKENYPKKGFDSVIEFVFVGSLVIGKNPMYAVQLIENLIKEGKNAVLHIYGDGIEKESLLDYIKSNQLENSIFLHGNQSKEVVKKAYQESHFVILPSKSEGWPKAVAEAMFWGCVPLSTNVSCVSYMLDHGRRGILLNMNLEKDTLQVDSLLANEKEYLTKSNLALIWSQNYTTEVFENEIKKLLVK